MERFRWFKQIFGHKYYKRILYLSISSSILLIIIATSAFYAYIYRNASQNKYENDMENLLQLKKNFENTNRLVNNICREIFDDSSVRNIMYTSPDELKRKDIKSELMNISSEIKLFEPYIHSVYIYNKAGKKYYSAYTDNVSRVIDLYLEKTVLWYSPAPKSVPVLRKIKTNNPDTIEYQDVFSYFTYEKIDENNLYDEAVVLNIEPQWFLDNLYSLNPNKDERYFLMASDRQLVNVDNSVSDKYLDDLNTVYYSKVMDKIIGGNFSDMIPCYLDGTKNILSYIYLKNERFIIYKIQTYDSVYAGVRRVKSAILAIAALIVFISLLFASFMAGNIYKPFEKLVRSISRYSGFGGDNCGHFDEMGFLENSYKHNVDEIFNLKKEVNSSDIIKYKYYLTQLLINSRTVTEKEITDIGNSGLFNVNMRDTLSLMILKLDSNYMEKVAAQDVGSWMEDTLSKDLGSRYVNDVINLENNNIVAIVNTGGNDGGTDDKEALKRVISEMQRKTFDKFGFSFAAAVSNPVNSINKLSKAYSTLKKYLSYSYIYGNEAIITSELIEGNVNNTSLSYPLSDEEKLICTIKEQKYEMVAATLDGIIKILKRMSYNNVIISVVHLCNTVCMAINEINKANFNTKDIDIFDINPLEYNTIDELQAVLAELIRNSLAGNVSERKHEKMVQAVKHIVCSEYADPSLSLNSIAEKIKISPNYLNAIFKSICGCSIADFVTDYRLGKAVEILETTGDSINAIMSRVGIENASTFYRCFKSRFGATPKNYLAKRICEKLIE